MSGRRLYKPPRIAAALLNRILPDEGKETPLGDFEEFYNTRAEKDGVFWARLWYWKQILILVPGMIRQSAWWSGVMFNNYLKTAVRNLLRYKGYSFLNISGLAFGMAACMLILLWVLSELSFDRFHENADNIYRVAYEEQVSTGSQHYWNMPPPLAPALQETFPGIEKASRIRIWGSRLVRHGDTRYVERGFAFVDPDFLRMFSFRLLMGDPESALNAPNSVVITQDMAEKYFGDVNPMGKTLNVDSDYDLTVTGVLENMPAESSFQFDFLAQFPFIYKFIGRDVSENWGYHAMITYVQLGQGSSMAAVNDQIGDFLKDHYANLDTRLYLQPLKEVHLHNLGGGGAIIYVYIFSAAALLVLLIACINFVNLTTARSANRAKEVGIRKVTGARASDLRRQFFGESIFMSLLALLTAAVLVVALLPFFNELTGKQLGYTALLNAPFAAGLLAIALTTGIVSGTYPAFYLSSFQPVHTLKGALRKGAAGGRLRKTLVVTQFALTTALLIISIAVHNQVEFMRTKDLGIAREHIVYMPMRGALKISYEPVKNELLRNPAITGVTGVSDLPGIFTTVSTVNNDWEGKDLDKNFLFDCLLVDFNFTDIFDLPVTQGRFYNREIAADTAAGFVLNETAVRDMGLESPIGKKFRIWELTGTIIGVVKDFHTVSLHKKIDPLALLIDPEAYDYMVVKIDGGDIPGALGYMEEVCTRFNPDYPFDYGFFDERFESQYTTERRLGSLSAAFTLTAIAISCLGLFGLAAFMAERRTKEIGIRKTLGASVPGILTLLTGEFARWVVLANVIAWPAAWYGVNEWLRHFAYRADFGWSVFVTAGLLTLAVAVITVSYQTYRAARTNPVDSLRHE